MHNRSSTKLPYRWITFLLTALLIAAGLPTPVLAETQILENSTDYTFGETVTFRARLQVDVPVEQASILIRAEGETQTQVRPVEVAPQEAGIYALAYIHDLSAQPLRAFAKINYHYEVALQGGQSFTSPTFTFFYEDNRFAWHTQEDKPFRVHLPTSDIAFGQGVLDVAHEGLKRVQSLFPLPGPQQVEIYVYTSATEMQATLTQSETNWVAGHADPDLGVMVVALPDSPERRLLMEQRIPHELMHIMLYHIIGSSYASLPTWLNEGLASAAELYPNPDYQVLLNNARQKNSLLPIVSLCHTFPRDASNALLAYAQSASFTHYLHGRFGTSGLQQMVDYYANGADCESGVVGALGVSLAELERQWRHDILAENVTLTALNNFLPWLILLLIVLAAPAAIMLLNRIKLTGFKAQETGDKG